MIKAFFLIGILLLAIGFIGFWCGIMLQPENETLETLVLLSICFGIGALILAGALKIIYIETKEALETIRRDNDAL